MVRKGRPGPKGKRRARKSVCKYFHPKTLYTNQQTKMRVLSLKVNQLQSRELSNHQTMQTCSQPNNKKAKVITMITNLTDEQEEVIIELLTEHPEANNKKLNKYNSTKSKTAFWETKARELICLVLVNTN